MSDREYEVLRIPSLVESGYEVVDTATMSLSQRLIACLDNDQMSDVQLVGDDGIKVPACKFVLGSTSPNLQTALYQGKEKSVFNIPNSRAKTLRAVVEFSCSDMLNTAIWADTEPVEIVEDMIALAKLGEMYALPNLKQQVSDVLAPCLEQLPSLACVAYNLVDSKTTPELLAASLEVLRKKPYQAFVKGPGGEIGGIACLSPEKLDAIFRDPEVNAEEIFLFQCLQEWKAANHDVYSNTDQICGMVVQNLDFSAMNASDIEDIVLPSGVVDSGLLVSGLMTLAKAAEKKGISLSSSRRKPAKTQRFHDANISRSSGKSGRGRRFKKPDSPSIDGSYMSTGSEQEGRREENTTAPVPVVETPTSPTNKKTRSFGFKKPNYFKSRASRFFLGSMRIHNVKEAIPEVESMEVPMPKMSSNTSALEKKSSYSEASVSSEGKMVTDSVKECVSSE